MKCPYCLKEVELRQEQILVGVEVAEIPEAVEDEQEEDIPPAPKKEIKKQKKKLLKKEKNKICSFRFSDTMKCENKAVKGSEYCKDHIK